MLKIIKHHFKWRMERFYRRNKWHLILDVSLLTIVVALIAVVIGLFSYNPQITLPKWITPATPQVDLSNPPLSVDVKIKDEALYPDEAALVEVSFKNSGNQEINDLNLSLVVNNDNFVVSKIENASSEMNSLYPLLISGNQITIAKIPAGATAAESLKVYFKSKSRDANLISWQASIQYNFYKQAFKNVVALADIKLAARVQAQAAAYYNSPQGDQLGYGPLPPIVDLPTNFWIFFKAQPTGNFNSFVMSAKLPSNVNFTGNSSLLAGDLSYNQDSRQIIWRIDNLIAGGPDYRAGFEVELIPSAEQVGKVAALASDLRFQALDAFSGLKDSGSLDNLNTSLEEDLINKGSGKVVSE